MIPFNKPFLTGVETQYITEAVNTGKLSGNGAFTKKCQDFFQNKFGFEKCLLTTSCTDALEMCAILIDIKPGDEVIMSSYTFVSTANSFILRGAKVVFCDSKASSPGIEERAIEGLITSKTKAIVAVHYAGVACDMKALKEIANKHNLYLIEDAAQSINSKFENEYLGGIGDLATFSFHETKNISCGEGGMLVINNQKFAKRAEIIWEKGTNRASFFRGEVDKYGWVDIGSSYLPSELNAACLLAQLESLERIQSKRLEIWNEYYKGLSNLSHEGKITIQDIPIFASNNAHMFYFLCRDLEERSGLISFLKERSILAVFHYMSLHKSPFFKDQYEGSELPNSDYYQDTLVRLPLYYELSEGQVQLVIKAILEYYESEK